MNNSTLIKLKEENRDWKTLCMQLLDEKIELLEQLKTAEAQLLDLMEREPLTIDEAEELLSKSEMSFASIQHQKEYEDL